jgi:hypothetical protein
MAIYYTERQKAEIVGWLLELRRIVNPVDFPFQRDRARELVAFLDGHPTHPACPIAYEFGRLRRIWHFLSARLHSAPSPASVRAPSYRSFGESTAGFGLLTPALGLLAG